MLAPFRDHSVSYISHIKALSMHGAMATYWGFAPVVTDGERVAFKHYIIFIYTVFLRTNSPTHLHVVLLAGFSNLYCQVSNHDHTGNTCQHHISVLFGQNYHPDKSRRGIITLLALLFHLNFWQMFHLCHPSSLWVEKDF